MLGLIGAHHTGIVHQVGSDAQLGKFAFARSVAQGEAEDVVLRIGRVVQLGAVVQGLDFDVAEVDKFLFHLSDAHILELHGIERLLAYGRLDGLVAGFLDFLAFLGLALFDVECQVVVAQVLLHHTFDVVGGNGHHFILVVQYFGQVFSVDEGVHQEMSLEGVGLHLYVEVAAEVHLDGLYLPILKFSVSHLLDGFQRFLFGALVGFEAALVLIVEGDALHDVASLLTHGHGGGSAIGQFAVEGQLVEGTRVVAVAQEGHGDFQRQFIGMSGGHTGIDEAYAGVDAHLGGVLGTSFYLQVGVGLALGQGLRLQSSEGACDVSGYLLGVDVAHEDEDHILGHVPLVVEVNELAQVRVLEVFGQTDDVPCVGMSLECLGAEEIALLASGIVLIHIIFFVHIL